MTFREYQQVAFDALQDAMNGNGVAVVPVPPGMGKTAPVTIDVIAIDRQINDAISALHARTPRANARRIVNGTYSVLLADALKLRRPSDETLTLREHGGFVANSAKFPGEADYLEVLVNLATGAADVKCYRARSQCRPNGVGPLVLIRLSGRIVFRS